MTMPYKSFIKGMNTLKARGLSQSQAYNRMMKLGINSNVSSKSNYSSGDGFHNNKSKDGKLIDTSEVEKKQLSGWQYVDTAGAGPQYALYSKGRRLSPYLDDKQAVSKWQDSNR